MGSYSDIIKKLKKDWDSPDLMNIAATGGKKLPFSSPLLNYATYGGIPRGCMTEFFGQPSGGKSTTAVDICKNACDVFAEEFTKECNRLREDAATGNKQAALQLDDLEESGPKKVLYVDLEHSFDAAWSKTLGIDLTEIDIMQPPNIAAEDILQNIQEIIETGEMGLVVLDSVPSLTTRQELEKKFGERTVASLAGLMTVFCRKIVPILKRYDTTLLVINQTRVNMDSPYVVSTPGGEALKFYCSLRIQFKIGSPIDFVGNELPNNSENPAGHKITARIVKQKSAPHDRKNASYYLMSASGIRVDMDYVLLAVQKYGIISKRGAWFSLLDPYTQEVLEDQDNKPIKINGLAKVFDFVNTNPEYYARLKKFIQDDIEGNGVDDPDASNELEEEYDGE